MIFNYIITSQLILIAQWLRLWPLDLETTTAWVRITLCTKTFDFIFSKTVKIALQEMASGQANQETENLHGVC